MITPELYNRNQVFAGTKGLVFFGEGDKALSYTRDNNTLSFPGWVDLPGGGREGEEYEETPFETFNRELDEEFRVTITEEQVIFGRSFPSMLDPSIQDYFLVARAPESLADEIVFGEEGESYAITPLPELIANPRLIPTMRERIRSYQSAVSTPQPEIEVVSGIALPTLGTILNPGSLPSAQPGTL